MTTDTPPTVAETLAKWTAELTFDVLPAAVVEVAKECLRDALACAILGSSKPRTDAYASLIPQCNTGGEATVIGKPWRSSIVGAAFVNAIYTHSCELDDGFVGSGGHPGAVVIPAALAVAEDEGLGGKELLAAIVAGYEVMYRSTAPIHPYNLTRGFQATGLGGPFGAAAAVATLRRLSAESVTHALAIAGSFSSGLCEYDQSGGEVKRLYAGSASRAGIEAVTLASGGVTGPPTIFEGPRGVFKAFSDHCEPRLALAELGVKYRILQHRIKTYPAVGSVHGAIDAIRAMQLAPLKSDEISEITVRVPTEAILHGAAIPVPWDLVSAQFSMAFSVAICLAYGRNHLDLYEDPQVRSNSEIVNICQKVHVVECSESDGLSKGGAVVILRLADGTEHERIQQAPSGSPLNPLTTSQKQARFVELTNGLLPNAAQQKLDQTIDNLENLTSLQEVLHLLSTSS